ncbi:MAG: MFS transporter [Candidatus Woesearchaeota archaeon]
MKTDLQVLLYSSFYLNLSLGLLGPIYALFVQEIGGDVVAAGTSFAIFSIVCGILIIFISRWEDSFSNLYSLFFLSRILCLIAVIGYLFVQTVWHLYIVQFVLGVALAIGNPPFDTLYTKNLNPDKMTSQWGIWEAQYQIVLGISAILGGWIVYLFGFQILLVVMVFLNICAVIYAFILYKRHKLEEFGRRLHGRH